MSNIKVRDVMTRAVVTVAPGTPLREVARILAERGISGAPVVDEADSLIGIISEGDFLAKQRGRSGADAGGLLALWGRRPVHPDRRVLAQTAIQAMTAPAVTIEADRTLREAAALMIDRAINRLPVMSDGRLVGIVTRGDLVRAYVHRDDETLRVIRDNVLHDTMWIDPDDLGVEVRDGHVRLAGRVDRRSTATIIEKLVGLVDGVDQVESFLTWDAEDTRLPPALSGRETAPGSLFERQPRRSMHR